MQDGAGPIGRHNLAVEKLADGRQRLSIVLTFEQDPENGMQAPQSLRFGLATAKARPGRLQPGHMLETHSTGCCCSSGLYAVVWVRGSRDWKSATAHV